MKCELCGHEDKSAAEKELGDDLVLMVDHFRVMHPDLAEHMEFWPDGALVVHDETLTPEDFGGDA